MNEKVRAEMQRLGEEYIEKIANATEERRKIYNVTIRGKKAIVINQNIALGPVGMEIVMDVTNKADLNFLRMASGSKPFTLPED